MANRNSMDSLVLDFQDIDKTMTEAVGGKGANLGELARIGGIHVPDGCCITTGAYKNIVEETPLINDLLNRLSLLEAGDLPEIRELGAGLRKAIEQSPIPPDISEEIARHISGLGEKDAYAIRSSATAEDMPGASFAGQQDTYLNIIGEKDILKHISKCWASLFTERAIIYRMRNGFDHRKVSLSVVVQKMIFPQVAGILFTADPLTANRKVSAIDASFGLGEALVSGLVSADGYKVRSGNIIDKQIACKKLAVHAVKDGGTVQQEIAQDMQDTQALTDEQILELERTGRKIEAHFGRPQDIEWCLTGDTFYIVQSRPVTTLYPVPEAEDEENHVYASVGHQQMMTDPMKPLGLSFFLLTTTASMRTAGGRLFIDITQMLASQGGRERLLNTLGKSEPLIRDALTTIMERTDFIKPLPEKEPAPGKSDKDAVIDELTLEDGPAIVAGLIQRQQASLAILKQNIRERSGTGLFDFILEDLQEFKKILLNPQSYRSIMASIDAAAWINEKMNEWLGEKNAADTLAQSVPGNVTSEMGLALLDVADVIRPYPHIIDHLKHTKDDHFPGILLRFEGGQEARDALNAYLDKYGMRCAGEIDITRTRWSERPGMLIPLILGNIKSFEPGEGKRKFEQGRQEALKKEQDLSHRLIQLPDGEQKLKETKQMIAQIRNFAGYREYPKYAIVSRYMVYKQGLMREVEQLVAAGIIHEKEDSYYLTLEELREVAHTRRLDYRIISKRKEDYKIYEKLTPPRLITSEGEIITGAYKREDLPAGALPGLAVSSGIIEGRARVILNMEEADLEAGDILVTSFTDPSWTPLFVSIKGLVTEVGGLMTHGAVIAREYGLPAVVGVEQAATLIKDGQRIRVNGTDGYVEIL